MDRTMTAQTACRVLASSAVFAVLANLAVAQTQVAINNPGFEADPVAPGCFAVFQPQGWQPFDPGGILDSSLDVLGGLYPEGGPYYMQLPPEGQHVAIVFLAGDTGTTPAGLTQVLTESLQPNRRYALNVNVGNIASGTGPPPCDVFGFFNLDGFPGYQIQLLAGGVVIAQDDNTLAGLLDDGEFGLSTIHVDAAPDHPQLGQQLEVRLINLNIAGTPQQPGIEVNFDDVRLIASPLEEPCVADFNQDNTVDFFDILAFLAALAGEDERSDLNLDGMYDFFDVLAFLAIFSQGCP